MARQLIGKVLIYSRDDTQVEAECAGPRWFGGCPRAAAGERVACAGRRVVVMTDEGREIVLEVEPDATACPLVAFPLGAGDGERVEDAS